MGNVIISAGFDAESPYDEVFRLDDRTREVGRRGLAAARATLACAGSLADRSAAHAAA